METEEYVEKMRQALTAAPSPLVGEATFVGMPPLGDPVFAVFMDTDPPFLLEGKYEDGPLFRGVRPTTEWVSEEGLPGLFSDMWEGQHAPTLESLERSIISKRMEGQTVIVQKGKGRVYHVALSRKRAAVAFFARVAHEEVIFRCSRKNAWEADLESVVSKAMRFDEWDPLMPEVVMAEFALRSLR